MEMDLDFASGGVSPLAQPSLVWGWTNVTLDGLISLHLTICFLFDFSRVYKVVSSADNYPVILSKLQEEGIKFEPDNGSELLPITPIEVRKYNI